MRRRFWVETALGSASGLCLLATVIRQDWAEELFAVDPDRSDGSLESMAVVLLAATCALLLGLAAREWRNRAPFASAARITRAKSR